MTESDTTSRWWTRWTRRFAGAPPVGTPPAPASGAIGSASVTPEALAAAGPPDATGGEVALAGTLWGAGTFIGARGERYNPDQLVGQKGWGIYERMLRDDQVTACLALVNAAVSSRAWTFEVTDQVAQGPVLDFLRFTLNDVLKGTVRQLFDQMLSARVFGFSLVEKVYGPVEWGGRTMWTLTAFKLRPAWTFTFRADPYGNVQCVVQSQGGTPVELDPARFVHTVNQSEYDPLYGRSALVPVYEHWWAKTNVLKFWNIYLERMAAGFLHGKKSGPLTPADNASLQTALANLQTATSILTPASVSLEYVHPPTTSVFQDREASLNRAIARALLIPTHLGFTDQGSTGSHAQTAAQVDVFFWWLDALCAALEDTLNEQLFREIVAWNFGSVPAPRFRFERRTPEQRREIAKAWAEAVQAGTVTHSPEDELRIRQMLDMPIAPLSENGVAGGRRPGRRDGGRLAGLGRVFQPGESAQQRERRCAHPGGVTGTSPSRSPLSR
jgi:hypothetical protein